MAARRSQKVVVLLTSEDEDKELMVRAPPTVTVRELKSRWLNKDTTKRPSSDILLRTSDGNFPTDEVSLDQFQDCSNTSQVIELTVLCGRGVWVSFNREQQLLPVNAVSMTPQQLGPKLRELFSYPSSQDFRLRANTKVLKRNSTLMTQGVGPGVWIQLDLSVTLIVNDLWSPQKELRLEAFTNQSLLEVLPSSWRGQLKILKRTSECEVLEPSQTIRDFAGQLNEIRLEVNRTQQIPLLWQHQVHRPPVWAEDTPDLVIPLSSEAQEVTHGYNRKPLPAERPFESVCRGAMASGESNALFHVNPTRLVLRDGEAEETRYRVMRLPRDALLDDARQVLLSAGRTSARDEELVDDDGKGMEPPPGIARAEFKDGAVVQLAPAEKSLRFTVFIGQQEVSWEEVRKTLTFSEMALKASALGQLSRGDLLHSAFRCCGCGRRICAEEEEFQPLPVLCCRFKSLTLRQVKNKDVQTRRPRFQNKASSTRKMLREKKSAPATMTESGSQTVIPVSETESMECKPLSLQYEFTDGPLTLVPPERPEEAAPRSTSFLETRTDIEVTLALPTKDRAYRTTIKKDITISRFIENLSDDNPYFPVSDIIVNGRQLSNTPDWQQKTLAACNVHSGDSIQVVPGRPDTVTLLTMHLDSIPDRENVQLEMDEWSWGSLWQRIKDFFATSGTDPITFVSMNYVDRLAQPRQIAVRAGSLLFGTVAHYDQVTAVALPDEEDSNAKITFANEFLKENSGFRAPPTCSPILHIHTMCNVLCLRRPDSPISDVCETTKESIFNQTWVTLIWGLQTRQALYLELSNGRFFNVANGDAYDDAISVLSISGGDIKRIVFLMRDKERVPSCRLPEGSPIKVWCRRNLFYRIIDRRIQVNNVEDKFDAVWTLTKTVGNFQRDLTATMQS